MLDIINNEKAINDVIISSRNSIWTVAQANNTPEFAANNREPVGVVRCTHGNGTETAREKTHRKASSGATLELEPRY